MKRVFASQLALGELDFHRYQLNVNADALQSLASVHNALPVNPRHLDVAGGKEDQSRSLGRSG